MNRDDALVLFSRLLHGIAPEADLNDIDLEAPLQDAFDLDSMDFLNLMTALDEEVGIEVPERDYPKLGTVGGFVDYVVDADRRRQPTG
jgi:acyl carrier protein